MRRLEVVVSRILVMLSWRVAQQARRTRGFWGFGKRCLGAGDVSGWWGVDWELHCGARGDFWVSELVEVG